MPTAISPSERQQLQEFVSASKEYKTIDSTECGKIVLNLLRYYYQPGEDINAQAQMLVGWNAVLRVYSEQTVREACLDWLSNAKRRPTPGDIRELCAEIDQYPECIERAKRALLVADEQHKSDVVDNRKMLGCPLVLATILRQAKAKGITYTEQEQDDYLLTGREPSWYAHAAVPVLEDLHAHLPTRDELLANMLPEERIIATRKQQEQN